MNIDLASSRDKIRAEQARILQQKLDQHRDEFFKRLEKSEVARKIFQGGQFMSSSLNPKNVMKK